MSNIIDLIIKDSKILSNIGNIAHNSHNNNDDNNSHYDDDDDDDNEDKFSHNKSLTKEEIDEFISKDVIKFYKDKSFKSFSSLIDVINELDNLQSSKLFEALDVLKKNSSYSFLSLPTRLQEYYNYHNIKKYDCLVVSHNARLRCFLVDHLNEALNNTLKDNNNKYGKDFKEIRFKNACVLQLILYKNKCTFDLIYGGDVKKRKPGYYFKTHSDKNGSNNNSIDVTFPKTTIDINDHFEGFDPNIIYNIYIVRHGEASHNVRSINIETDTNLTEEGIKSVTKTGDFLKEIKFNYVFSSPLYRAIKTTQIILDNNFFKEGMEINILNCANEVPFCKTGNCDSKGINIAPENTAICNINHSLKKCQNVENYPIQWKWYRSLNVNCSKTNFVNLIILFISSKNE